MSKLFDIFRIGWQVNERLLLQVPRRGIRYQESVKWVRPQKKRVYDPVKTGDLTQFPEPKYDEPYLPFKDSKELQNADEKVKKIFSLRYQVPVCSFRIYRHELVERVKRHALDENSEEVLIAKLTARIRFYQSIIFKQQHKKSPLRHLVKLMVDKRRKKLKELRLKDYKKYEWLLEKLDLEFRNPVSTADNSVTRKKSLVLLARLKVEKTKEEKLSELKKEFDQQKIPFLEKKITQLKKIKELEEKHNLPVTVKEEDIEECVKRLETVKIEVAERASRGYKRKIHPYFLEAYDEDLLREKEKEGAIIREQMSGGGNVVEESKL